MPEQKQPKKPLFSASHCSLFDNCFGQKEADLPSPIERDEQTANRTYYLDKRVRPIVKKHDLRRKSELFQYRFFPRPKKIDEQGMYLMLRKTMVLCREIGIPKNGIPFNESNDLFEGPDVFESEVMDTLHNAEAER